MKSPQRLLLAAVMIAVLVTGAYAQSVSVRWDSDGIKSLTEDGWTLAGTVGDGLAKSEDCSNGQPASGTNGVWHINDDNIPTPTYMRMYKDPSGISSSQGLVMARVKAIRGNSVYGTFGYSSASGNHSVVLCIRAGAINWKTAEGGNMVPDPMILDTTSDYRVYAIRWYAGGTFDAWYSTTNDWSPNQSDWVQVVSGGHIASGSEQSALIDHTGARRNGLLMGSFGTSSTVWEGNVDYMAWSKVTEEQLPWNFPPASGLVPDDAQVVGHTIPSVMTRGLRYDVSVTLKNIGTGTWTAAGGHKLGGLSQSYLFCGTNPRVLLEPADSVAPGQEKTFNFTMTAPMTLGAYTVSWRMIKEAGQAAWFGDSAVQQITVDMGPLVPSAPIITSPSREGIVGSQYPDITWTGDTHDRYQVRIGTSDSPTSNNGWDSGEVWLLQPATTTTVTTPALAVKTKYYVFVRLHNNNGWGPWSALGHSFYTAGELLNNPYYVGSDIGGQEYQSICYNYKQNEYLICYYDIRPDVPRTVSYYILHADGTKSVGEITLSHTMDGTHMPTVAYNKDADEYLICFTGWHALPSVHDHLFAQRVNALTGLPTGSSFEIYYVAGGVRYPDMAYSPVDKTYMLVWADSANGGRALGMRLSGTTGQPVSGTIDINQGDNRLTSIPAITYNAENDEYLVSFQVSDASTGWDYYARLVKADGTLLGPSVKVVDTPTWEEDGDVAYDSDLDRYIVTYHGNYGGGSIWAQFVKAVNDPVLGRCAVLDGSRIALQSPTTPGVTAAVDWQPNTKEFLVAWQDGGSANNYARRLSQAGVPIGEPFKITGSILGGGNWMPTPIANTSNDEFLFCWSNERSSIYTRRYKAYNTVDIVAPGPVTGFTASAGDGQVMLTWANPAGADYTGTTVLCKTTGYPSTPEDGTVVYDGTGSSFTHTGLTNGVTYYYAAFAHDALANYASASISSAVPRSIAAAGYNSSAFDSGSDGWNIVRWRSGTLGFGSMTWYGDVGNPGGGMRCAGTGITDSTERCTREGGEIWKVIPTTGYRNIQISYDLKVGALGGDYTGAGVGGCAVDHNLVDEQLTVFYSTDGGQNWHEAETLRRDALLGYQSYRTRQINLGALSGVDDNPYFALRFRWQFNTEGDYGDLDNIRVFGENGSITAVKTLAEDAPVSLGDTVLYLKQGIFGYIEEKDRFTGIRIEGNITANAGNLVRVSGTRQNTSGGEPYIQLGSISGSSPYDLKPLGASSAWLASPMMDGLYVCAWGRVAAGSVTANSFVLTDGSDPAGVKIVTQGAPGVSEGDFVMITGAAGFEGSRVIYRK